MKFKFKIILGYLLIVTAWNFWNLYDAFILMFNISPVFAFTGIGLNLLIFEIPFYIIIFYLFKRGLD